MCLPPQRRAIFPPFLDLWTSKSGPYPSVFWHFDFEMCFSPQRRAIFQHLNFRKWSEHAVFCTFWLQNVLLATAACNFSTSQLQEHAVFCTFWLQNVLLATAACNFSTSQLQKVVWSCGVLYILTSKCASRYSGVHFSTSQLQKVVRECCVLYILTSKCASRYSGVQFFMSPLNSYLRTRRFSEVTFRPSRPTNHWKTQHFATSLTFRACWSSFFPHLLIFFLAALLFQLSILSEVRLLNFLR